MSESTREHRRGAPADLSCGVVIVSSSRYREYGQVNSPSEAEDRSGEIVIGMLQGKGFQWVYRLVPDDMEIIYGTVEDILDEVDAVVVSGGTGLAPRDVTIEALEPLFEKTIPGFGELFRHLSYEEIGAAVVLTRASAGIIRGKPVFLLPGSTAAVRLAMERIIVPELGHVIKHLREK